MRRWRWALPLALLVPVVVARLLQVPQSNLADGFAFTLEKSPVYNRVSEAGWGMGGVSIFSRKDPVAASGPARLYRHQVFEYEGSHDAVLRQILTEARRRGANETEAGRVWQFPGSLEVVLAAGRQDAKWRLVDQDRFVHIEFSRWQAEGPMGLMRRVVRNAVYWPLERVTGAK